MKHYLFKKTFVPCVMLAGAIAFSGCTDSDYDFSGIDMTFGLGGDGLALPVSSTDTIKLADVLDLDGSECVVVKPNGDYVFEQVGNDVAPAHPQIDMITISQSSLESTGIPVTIVPVSAGIGEVNVSAEGEMLNFTYKGAKPADVVSLDHVGVDASMTLNISFPDVMKIAGLSVDEMVVELPSFMEISNVNSSAQYTLNGSRLVFYNIQPSSGLSFTASIKGLNFKASDTSLGSIKIEGNNIVLKGQVKAGLDITLNNPNISSSASGEITASLHLGDIQLQSATGRFKPSIDLDNLGNVNVTGVPDFLTDGNVVVDLYNPQILLSISSDMNVQGLISGTITAVKDGVNTATVAVNDIRVKPEGVTNICICRRSGGIDASLFDEVRVVDNLSDLIRTIPDRIEFSADAEADASQTSSFVFGKSYTIKPSYSIEAPITFDKDAKIVYTDTIADWNNDIKDLELADDSYINLSTTIENRVPAYLGVKVEPVDVDGNVMSENEISIKVTPETLQASEDGENSAETPLNIEIRQAEQGALKRLDGIAFRIEGGASDDGQNPVVGKTLNSEKHFLIARDIVVKLVGKIIGDFN